MYVFDWGLTRTQARRSQIVSALESNPTAVSNAAPPKKLKSQFVLPEAEDDMDEDEEEGPDALQGLLQD